MAISAKNLARSYKDHTGKKEFVFQDVDFEANLSEITLVMGKSGTGKSTLLNLLALIDPVSTGELFYFDHPVHGFSSNKRASLRASKVGFIFQQFALINEFTILDNVAIPLVLAGESWKEARQSARQILQELIPGINENKKPGELSGGQQQRVAIARALVHKPSILIADEPTGNLDDENAALVWELISSLVKNHNMAGIIVTHDERLADKADRLYRFEPNTTPKLPDEMSNPVAKNVLVRVYG